MYVESSTHHRTLRRLLLSRIELEVGFGDFLVTAAFLWTLDLVTGL